MSGWKNGWRLMLMAVCVGVMALLFLMGMLRKDAAVIASTLDPSRVQPDNGQLTLTVTGPDIAWLHQVVTYNVYFTAPSSSIAMYYLFPTSFTVIRTDPVTSSSGPGILQWTAGQLSGRNMLRVIGKHRLGGGCSPAVHTAGFSDPYNPQLPRASKVTDIADLRCAFLPLTMKMYSAER